MIKMNMKNYLIIGIILLFPFRLFADEPVKAIYAKITNPDNKEVTVVANPPDGRLRLHIGRIGALHLKIRWQQ